MVPRLTRTEISVKLKGKFPDQVKFIENIIKYMLDDENNLKQNGNCFFQSLSITERRLYSILSSITPIIKGKRGVILSNYWGELEYIVILLAQCFPSLKIKLIDSELVQKHWNWVNKRYWEGDGDPDDFKGYNILLCEPHSFLRLNWDFKNIITNIGAICFHEVMPSEWYYNEILAIASKLALSTRSFPIPRYFSSISDLPHIRTGEIISHYELPTFREDVSWSNLVIPITEFTSYDSYLRKSIIKLARLEDSDNNEIAKILILTYKKDFGLFYRLVSEEWDYLEESFEVFSPNNEPEIVRTADIVMIEDTLLDLKGSPHVIKHQIGNVLSTLQYLKPDGEVIFFSPLKYARGNEAWLSGMFPIKFNRMQKEALILFLQFHDCLLEKDLMGIIDNFFDNSLIQINPLEFLSIYNCLRREELIKKIRGRYTCTHREKDTHNPDGRTVVRYRGFLENKIQRYFYEMNSNEIDSERKFQNFGIKVRELVKKLSYCPNIDHLQNIIQSASFLISEEELNWKLDNQLDHYTYPLSNFSRLNPDWQKYDPRKDTPEDSPEEQGKPEIPSPYRRKKSVGRKCGKDRRSCVELEAAVLRLIRHRENETHIPIHWEDISQELSIPRSTGYRIVQKLIEEGYLKEVPRKLNGKSKQFFLEPKYLDKNNKLGFRGRPRKYVVTKDFDLASIDKKTCGKCRYFHVNRCDLISDLIEMRMQELIPYKKIQKLVLNKKVSHLEIIRRMMACKHFDTRKRDYQLKSLRVTPITELQTDGRGIIEVDKYMCAECGGDMDYLTHPRTIRCPKCHTKYSWINKGKTATIKVNVDYHSAKNELIRKICGVIKERVLGEDELVKQKKAMTKKYRKQLARKKQETENRSLYSYLGNIFQFLYRVLKTDFEIRKNLNLKYGTAKFYTKRLLAILLSYTLATMEYKTLKQYEIFEDIDVRVIADHMFVQLDQIRKLFQPTKEKPDTLRMPTLKEFQTAERVIANHCWQVNKIFFDKLGFVISNRKLLRYVNEFMMHPFRGSKGYTPGNTLINCAHKICYESTRDLMFDSGYGLVCPGVAEHTHPKFGIVLDLSDPVKVAYRISLIKAIIEGKITDSDFYSVYGRHNREIYLMKTKSFRKLEITIKAANQKVIYPIINSTGQFIHDEIPLWKAFEQFITRLARDLKSGDELESAFVYAPIKEDYAYVANILMDYNIPIPSITS